jgi:hypothetical protein
MERSSSSVCVYVPCERVYGEVSVVDHVFACSEKGDGLPLYTSFGQAMEV